MPEWKKIVREKLGTLPLTNGRRDEVIEELAQQLESAYEEALAQGINEQEAMRRSLAQFKDWEKLRGELFQSVEGSRLPVWEQNGFFSPRRAPVWIALALTLLLLATPSFHQALTIMPLPGRDYSAWSPRVFSESAVRRIEQSGDKEKYARTLAYVALHDPDGITALNAAKKAIALDPQLTWISAQVSHVYVRPPSYDPHPWIERLKAWDPQNGFVYLLEAAANVHYWEPPWSKYGGAPLPGLRSALVAEPRWRIPMEKAFAAPRIDTYGSRHFTLDRQVLKEQGLDDPVMLMIASGSQLIPDFTAIKMYASYQIEDVGERAEKAGRPADALGAYWNVAHFGEKFHMGIVEMLEVELRREAYAKMLPLLRREGRTSEAAAVESALTTLLSLDHRLRQRAESPSSSSRVIAERSARVVGISMVVVAFLGIATALWLVSILALKWREHASRLLNRIASVLCFAPPALLFASIVLFLGYYPYARSIAQIHSFNELEQGYGLFIWNLYDGLDLGSFVEPWLTTMFWPTVWCATVALVGACLLWLLRRRVRPDRPDVA